MTVPARTRPKQQTFSMSIHRLFTKSVELLQRNSISLGNVVFTKNQHLPLIGIRNYVSKRQPNEQIELEEWQKSLDSITQRKLRYIENEVKMQFSTIFVKIQ